MSQKNSTQQESQKKTSARTKVRKAPVLKSKKADPSTMPHEKRIAGKKRSSINIEDDLAGDIQAKVAQRAHELYEQRGRVHGNDWEDWLKAEREIVGGEPPI